MISRSFILRIPGSSFLRVFTFCFPIIAIIKTESVSSCFKLVDQLSGRTLGLRADITPQASRIDAHLLNRQGVSTLIELVLGELLKLWEFNKQQPRYQVSLDGQISNWVINEFDPQDPQLDLGSTLSYIDTSTPVYMRDGVEQFDPELVIRTTPRLLATIIRMFFLEDVMTRYYDPRKVTIDILANFYKEGRPDLIPELVGKANSFFANGGNEFGVEEINEKEIRDYYREDAFIWSFLSSARRFDRFLYRKILRREYPFILPGKVKR